MLARNARQEWGSKAIPHNLTTFHSRDPGWCRALLESGYLSVQRIECERHLSGGWVGSILPDRLFVVGVC